MVEAGVHQRPWMGRPAPGRGLVAQRFEQGFEVSVDLQKGPQQGRAAQDLHVGDLSEAIGQGHRTTPIGQKKVQRPPCGKTEKGDPGWSSHGGVRSTACQCHHPPRSHLVRI